MTQRDMQNHGNKHRLRVLNKLGKGAFGQVYKGTYDGEVVAIKTVISQEADHAALASFRREAEMLAGCNHGRIIGYKALCKLSADDKKHPAGGKWALVLEYAKGGSLSDKVSQAMIGPGKVYSNAQALSWALDVATALEYLHLRSPAVLHRDVKLGNLLLCKEENSLVAKLSDFGLHMVADDSQQRLLRVSMIDTAGGQASTCYITQPTTPRSVTPDSQSATALAQAQQQEAEAAVFQGGGGDRSNHSNGSQRSKASSGISRGNWSHLTQQHLQQLQQQLAPGNSSALVIDQDSAQSLRMLSGAGIRLPGSMTGQQYQRAREVCYGEMHDSSGSVPYIGNAQPGQPLGRGPQPESAAPGTAAAAERWRPPPRRAASFTGGGGDATAAADSRVQRAKSGPKRSVSFKLEPSAQRASLGTAAAVPAAAAGLGAGLAADDDGFADTASVCSMATDCTWVSDGTYATGSTGCSSDNEGSVTEVELVFNLTGKTGSYLYMAPEVWQNKPYNEKADVFSFGVVLYELLARCLIIFTELPTNSTDPVIAERYAVKVAAGYRPSRPKRMPELAWALIEACWQQEPALRPSMSQVVSELQTLLRSEQTGGNNSRHSSFSHANGSVNVAGSCRAGSSVAPDDAGPVDTGSTGTGTGGAAQATPHQPAPTCGCTIS